MNYGRFYPQSQHKWLSAGSTPPLFAPLFWLCKLSLGIPGDLGFTTFEFECLDASSNPPEMKMFWASDLTYQGEPWTLDVTQQIKKKRDSFYLSLVVDSPKHHLEVLDYHAAPDDSWSSQMEAAVFSQGLRPPNSDLTIHDVLVYPYPYPEVTYDRLPILRTIWHATLNKKKTAAGDGQPRSSVSPPSQWHGVQRHYTARARVVNAN